MLVGWSTNIREIAGIKEIDNQQGFFSEYIEMNIYYVLIRTTICTKPKICFRWSPSFFQALIFVDLILIKQCKQVFT